MGMVEDARLEQTNTSVSVALPRRVLFVNLDGTLVRTDLLWEGLVLAAKDGGFGSLLRLLSQMVRHRASGKKLLAERFTPDVRRLPYRKDVLEFLAEQRSQGVTLVLATASDSHWAKQVADNIALFDDVLASDGDKHLKGEGKLRAFEEYCSQNGFSSFEYIGDSVSDAPVWKKAEYGHVVEPTSRLLRSMERECKLGRVIEGQVRLSERTGSAIRALRPAQWVKNLLVFAPLFLAHEYFDVGRVLFTMGAFVAFCFCASAVYITNDLLDIESDRCHPEKRRRPFASGALPVVWGPPLAMACLGVGLFIAGAFLPASFLIVLCFYILLTSLYSTWLKQVVLVDVFVLSGLYMIRVIAGEMAANVAGSAWLMGFCLFLFVSLGFAKRYAELTRLEEEGKKRTQGRGYKVGDLSLIESIGPASGYIAVLVFALYIQSEKMPLLYTNSWALWLICPLLLYWISRVWLKAGRRELSEDPVLFAIKDRVSLLVAALVVIFTAIARPL